MNWQHKITSLMWIEKSNEERMKIVQVERVYSDESRDKLEYAELELKALVGRLD